jgi:DNA-binding response OmpR family regulator
MAKDTILVVDDDQDILDFLDDALTFEGYQVLTAVDGAALALAQQAQPSVILLDLQMAGMDGQEISRRLRADAATAAIPIIVMSAMDRLEAMVTGMPVNGHLAKPFELRLLMETVAQWCPQRSTGPVRPVPAHHSSPTVSACGLARQESCELRLQGLDVEGHRQHYIDAGHAGHAGHGPW